VFCLFIVDNNCNFTCFQEDLVASEDSEALEGECQAKRIPNHNKKNKLIQRNITNCWAYKKLQPHNKLEKHSEEKLLNNILIKVVILRNLKSWQEYIKHCLIHKKGNCMISMERKGYRMEDHLAVQALEICSTSLEEEKDQLAQKKESQN